jgi:hypothetical protein
MMRAGMAMMDMTANTRVRVFTNRKYLRGVHELVCVWVWERGREREKACAQQHQHVVEETAWWVVLFPEVGARQLPTPFVRG